MNTEGNKMGDIGGEMSSRAENVTMPFRRNRKNEWHIAALFLFYLCEKGELQEKIRSKNEIRKIYYSEFKAEFFKATPTMNLRDFPSFCLIVIMFLEKRLIMKMIGFESNVLQFHPQNVKTFLNTFQKCVLNKEKDKNEQSLNYIKSDGKSKKKKRSQVFIDQRFAFQLLEKFGNQVERIKDNIKNHCRTCNESFPSEDELNSHIYQEPHQIIYKYQRKREELVSFQHMLQISLINCDGVNKTCMKEEPLYPNRKDKTEKHMVIYVSGKDNVKGTLNLTLLNVHTSPIALCKILKNDECFKIIELNKQNKSDALYINPIGLPVQLSRGASVRINIKISTSSVGRNEYFMFLKFIKDKTLVYIMQKFCVLIESEFTVFESSQSTEIVEYKRPTENVFTIPSAKLERVRGSRKKRSGPGGSRNNTRTKDYVTPTALISILNHALRPFPGMTKDESQLREQICDMIKVGLGMDNYVNYFSLLLFIEQHQMSVDILKYSLKNEPLFQSSVPSLLALDVPGLAEKRPSVLRGDSIMVSTKDIPGVEFEGKVQRIENTSVLLKFSPKFMQTFIPNMKVDVRFDFSRRPHNLQHETLELMRSKGLLQYICFPTQFGSFPPRTQSKISWFNRLVEKNEKQRKAVINILNGSSRPAPYLLFGPPGTGKTMTIVEAILQILVDNKDAKVLVAAPSNAAVDVISSRLVKTLPVSQLLRVYSPSREWFQVPEALQNSCNYIKEKDSFEIPDMATVIKYKVVAVTMVTAGRLTDLQLPNNHFSHIFIDECAQGLEPESLISVAGLMDSVLPGNKLPTTQLVLSGDPLQLGPVLRSPIAKKLGLEKSLLERLMTTVEIYQRDANTNEYNPKLLTKLVKNFRSHPVILDLPNRLFYQGELEASADVGITHCACNWELLPKKNYPIIFHGVEGKEEKDNFSPSYFNTSEIHQVVKYLREILSSKFSGTKISPSEIGIISPYRRQVERIKNSLQKNGFGKEVSVASVEEFQGQERRVIIISTVRSDPQKISLDRVFRLGFLREPKRFNVAITRAKALLIIIGNPNVLQGDPCWGELLKYCYKLGCYTGTRFSFAQKESDEEDDDDDDDDDEDLLPSRNGDIQADKNIGWNINSVIDKFEKLSVKANDLSVVQKMIEPPWESHE